MPMLRCLHPLSPWARTRRAQLPLGPATAHELYRRQGMAAVGPQPQLPADVCACLRSRLETLGQTCSAAGSRCVAKHISADPCHRHNTHLGLSLGGSGDCDGDSRSPTGRRYCVATSRVSKPNTLACSLRKCLPHVSIPWHALPMPHEACGWYTCLSQGGAVACILVDYLEALSCRHADSIQRLTVVDRCRV
jgi:hypothetical protein